ncbi:MAG: hypothetical protein LBU23_09730 [Planctomycetota bacterium]|jgi:hypothetical protein|nr:hypothetical protein [Planctomycetota bacterium]
MERKQLIQGIIDYFHSPQWTEFMRNRLLKKDGEEVYHIHMYNDTSVHPKSLTAIVEKYFDAINRPLTRSTHPTAQRPGVAAVHGIHPMDCPHFEMIFRFNPDVSLAEMPIDVPEAEHGQNLLSWDRGEINDWVMKIPFQAVGPREDRRIRDYFKTRHWKDSLEYIIDPNVIHYHPNFEINFDPGILQLHVLREFERIGWTVDKVIPCLFDMKSLNTHAGLADDDPRNNYVAQLKFNLGWPYQKMFDIPWMYNPGVTIRPAVREWIFDTIGYDVWHMSAYDDFISASPYIELEKDEIRTIADSFYKDNPYIRKD